MSISGLLLGLINIAIVVAVLVLVGYIILWLMGMLGFPIPANVQKIYMVIVASDRALHDRGAIARDRSALSCHRWIARCHRLGPRLTSWPQRKSKTLHIDWGFSVLLAILVGTALWWLIRHKPRD